MKKLAVIVSLFILSASAYAQNAQQTKDTKPVDPQKAMYSLGVALSKNVVGYNFSQSEIADLTRGFTDALANKAKESDYDFKLISDYLTKKQQENAMIEKGKSKDFLAKAGKEKGVKKTKSGLLYTEITKGKGKSPKAEDTVKVHYKGTLIDGKQFDSSYDRGEPAEFPLGAVIPCWTEGLQMMKKGGKAKLVCPSDIAYGDMGRPPVIPGGAALVFEVELIDIVKEKAEPAKAQANPVKTEVKQVKNAAAKDEVKPAETKTE